MNVTRYNPDGSLFASAGADGKVILFEGVEGTKQGELVDDACNVRVFFFSLKLLFSSKLHFFPEQIFLIFASLIVETRLFSNLCLFRATPTPAVCSECAGRPAERRSQRPLATRRSRSGMSHRKVSRSRFFFFFKFNFETFIYLSLLAYILFVIFSYTF